MNNERNALLYERADIEVLKFENHDIVTASTGGNLFDMPPNGEDVLSGSWVTP